MSCACANDMNPTASLGWSDQLPREPGYCWFYGTSGFDRKPNAFTGLPNGPSLSIWRVREAGPEDNRFLMWIANGAFVYPSSEEYEGYWMPIPVPDLPTKPLED